ncbi:LANO_0A04742g1_1 [Lachancea nothofagi CBS 11611]|uniref:LANO_0A04742g1_1 n=1 Tax=Lachancea nothofagi CBS 11611 TaxID=1266666 RepID=A0A1G4IQF4_9SACH|nr:LANO_0A04742g1_1 [Lachancea nothofagi CBS 11611]
MAAGGPQCTLVDNSKKRKRATRESSLSEDQKRQNHVSSEQRRRQAMRQTYDTLVEMVPDLTASQSRSEMQIYARSYNYLAWLYERNRLLREELKQKTGSDAPSHLEWNIPTQNK